MAGLPGSAMGVALRVFSFLGIAFLYLVAVNGFYETLSLLVKLLELVFNRP